MTVWKKINGESFVEMTDEHLKKSYLKSKNDSGLLIVKVQAMGCDYFKF